MLRHKVTSADVAKRAGVSQSAVSRVFTLGASASPKTTEKVCQAAEDLGYRPNILARAMVSGKSRIIGLVISAFDNQFYPQALELFSKSLQQVGYQVMIFLAKDSTESVDEVVEEILDFQVEGIIAASVALRPNLIARCRKANIPIVMFNRDRDDQDLSRITSNNLLGGKRVAEFLLASGHQKIAYIAGWEGASTQRAREKGFVGTLNATGIKLFARGEGKFSSHKAIEATHQIFAFDPPDAVFVASDHMAFAVMDTLRHELGLRIPEDVSVVGFDDVPAASWPSYNLTTVRQPAELMVQKTVELLFEHINNTNYQPKKIVLDAPLIVRGSARLPQGEHDARL